MGLDNPLHIAFLVVLLLLVFGARRLPEIGRSLGTGMREFKDSISGDSSHSTLSQNAQQPQAPVMQAPVAQAPVAQPPVAQAPAPPIVQAPVAPAPPASPQEAAQAFGAGATPEQQPAPVEPTRQG